MTVKLPNEHHLEFINLKVGCTDSSESIHVKMPHYKGLLPNEHHLEFINLKVGCTDSSESIHVKMPHYKGLHCISVPFYLIMRNRKELMTEIVSLVFLQILHFI